jgi:hypothetical protein
MKTKSEFKKDIEEATIRYQSFVEEANLNGGMHLEARVKLLEGEVRNLMWFVAHLVDNMQEDDKGLR